MKDFDVWLVVDEDGEYAVGAERGEALDRYRDEIGDSSHLRILHLTVKAKLPAVTELPPVTVTEED